MLETTQQKGGRLWLIPVPITESGWETLPAQTLEIAQTVRHFFVENLRSARRFLRGIAPQLVIEDRYFVELLKHEAPDLATLRAWLSAGEEVGILSEAGCPGIADPGAVLVAEAHRLGIPVTPLTGPSSILLAVMASGFSGQSFAFNGYLPVKNPDRKERIRFYEHRAVKEGQTQVFIETPYRNAALLTDLLAGCNGNTLLCVAYQLGSPNPWVRTAPVREWLDKPEVLPKEPAVFLLAGK
jgi:16S rRNA (cytidine1402-2'-O)-methyltransferase